MRHAFALVARQLSARLSLGLVAAILLLGTFGRIARASSPEPDGPKEPESAAVGNEIVGDDPVDYFDDKTFLMGIVVLAFGLLVIIVQAWALRSSDAKTSVGSQMRYMIVLTVIIAALFSVVTGLSSQSVAPAMGLFGTIVGYLLGTGRERQKDASAPATGKGAQPRDGEQ